MLETPNVPARTLTRPPQSLTMVQARLLAILALPTSVLAMFEAGGSLYAPANRFAEVQRRSAPGSHSNPQPGRVVQRVQEPRGGHGPPPCRRSLHPAGGDVARTMLYTFELLTSANCALLSVLDHIIDAEE